MYRSILNLRWRLPLLLAMLTAGRAATPIMAAEPSRQTQLKAAFVYNFIQFVEWPDSAFAQSHGTFVVGVLTPSADDEICKAVEAAIAGKIVNNRTLVIRHCPTLEQARECHLLLVTLQAAKETAAAAKPRRAMLIVGEAETAIDAGAAIRLYSEGNRMRFEISPQAARRVGLKISAKLLKLARIREI